MDDGYFKHHEFPFICSAKKWTNRDTLKRDTLKCVLKKLIPQKSSRMGSPTVEVCSHESQGKAICENNTKLIVDNIFKQLSDNEKDEAAKASSYRYLLASMSSKEEINDQRDQHAKATIMRFVTVEQKLNQRHPNQWEQIATVKLQKTLRYRNEKQIDAVRMCFDEDKRSDSSPHATLRKHLEDRFKAKASIIRGYTNNGCALFQNLPRADTKDSNAWEEEIYIMGNIYMMERALACTERKTNGNKDKIIVLYDYNGYAMKNSPPPLIVKHLLSDLREHWPERLEHVFVIDAPFIFRAFWAIIKHFIDPITSHLVQFISGEDQKKLLMDLISEDQAAPYMYKNGKDIEEADMKAFFYDIPFDRAYGQM